MLIYFYKLEGPNGLDRDSGKFFCFTNSRASLSSSEQNENYMRLRTRFFEVLVLCQGLALSCAASDPIQSAGDILQYVLPAAAGGLTIAHSDWPGTLQFGESAAVTLAVTYALKYTVNEKRPNGGHQSFPSAHTSISFSSAEFMRKRYGWEYGVPAYEIGRAS